MSVTLTKGEGVSALIMTVDPTSLSPPLCQILKALCYSPACCSVSEKLRKIGGHVQSALGVIQIMNGLFNIALGAILCSSRGAAMEMEWGGYPYWLGALFIFFGLMCILSESFPSPCTVSLNVMMNLVGVPFAITAIVLYAVNFPRMWYQLSCSNDYYYYRMTEPPTTMNTYQAQCEESRLLILMLWRSINILLIITAVLQLCINISVMVLGCKTLRQTGKKNKQGIKDAVRYQPLTEGQADPIV